jgi:hypothetical protein
MTRGYPPESRADAAREQSAPGDDELVAVARREAAPDELVGRLATLPGGMRFENVQEVWTALGGDTEHRR